MVKTIARGVSLLLIIAIMLMALLPWPVSVPAPSDFSGHFTAFLVLSLLAPLAFDTVGLFVYWVCFSIVGGAIELLQMWMDIGRTAGWEDWFSDLGGAALGLVIVWIVRRLIRLSHTDEADEDLSGEA